MAFMLYKHIDVIYHKDHFNFNPYVFCVLVAMLFCEHHVYHPFHEK